MGENRGVSAMYIRRPSAMHAPSTVAFCPPAFHCESFSFRFVAETKFYIPLQHKFTKLQNLETLCHNSTGFRSIYTADELRERLRRIRHVALDMDGTIYMGMSLFSCTKALSVGIEASWASAIRSSRTTPRNRSTTTCTSSRSWASKPRARRCTPRRWPRSTTSRPTCRRHAVCSSWARRR